MPPQAPTQELCDRLGYQFSKPELLKQALTHKSCVHDGNARSPQQNNERFEFLGDAVLDLLISELLMDWWIGQGLSPCLERIVDCLGIEIGLAFWSRIG